MHLWALGVVGAVLRKFSRSHFGIVDLLSFGFGDLASFIFIGSSVEISRVRLLELEVDEAPPVGLK